MSAITKNASYYFMEAAGLGGFVLGAGLLAIFMEHPGLPPMQSSWKNFPLLRRVPVGIAMGAYICLITIWAGKKSGAHVNPATTWSFYSLGKISFRDAVLYTVAQFAGAIAAAQILKHVVGQWFSHPAINYGSTAPKPQYTSLTAFTAEFTISFILMFVMLTASASRKWEKGVPYVAAVLIALFIIFEMPFSGMSMNPARSTAADIAAGGFEHLWIYFVSPIAAMLLAAQAFRQWHKRRHGRPDRKELPVYPLRTG